MPEETPFHAGEEQVQKRLGVFEEIGPWAQQVVRPQLPAQHRDFYGQLPFLVAAARDGDGRPWATLLAGAPGFAHSPNPKQLVIDARPVRGDALEGHLGAGAELGLLGIELATRRRNRVNGRITSDGPATLEFEVSQAFGNCPQYIHEREWQLAEPDAEAPQRSSNVFTDELRQRIEAADTFFIATGHRGEGEAASFGMDASHRGGDPGFVQVLGDRSLVFPDYAGNNHFNTLGNLVLDDRVGLLFVDFEGGGLLQLTGRATIDWDSPEIARHPGARRLVRFELEEAIDLPASLPLRFTEAKDVEQPLRLIRKERESAEIVSFTFEADNGAPLASFEAGQHLPIELEIPGTAERVRRTYSLSNSPGEPVYRISVKRESLGQASRFLHDSLTVGSHITAKAPAGDFVLSEGERPIVLMSAGVGITPMLSMLRTLVAERDPRPVDFVHVARNGAHHAFREELRALVDAGELARSHVFYSRPETGDVSGRDFHREGRPDARNLADLIPALDADFYLCGPPAFMAEAQGGLVAMGVPADQVHSESFGPVG